MSRWIGVEHAIESACIFYFALGIQGDRHVDRVKSIISPDEQLTPGVLYVGVATLSGSILARNRFLPTRLFLPPVFLLVSTNYFLPKTSDNLMSYLASLEDTYFPTLAQKHDIANAHTRMTWERIKDSTENSRAWVNRGAEKTVHTIQELTGLKLRETLGWTHTVVQKAENGTGDRTFDRMKEKMEKKVDEVQKP